MKYQAQQALLWAAKLSAYAHHQFLFAISAGGTKSWFSFPLSLLPRCLFELSISNFNKHFNVKYIFFSLLYINYYICYLTFLWLGDIEGMAAKKSESQSFYPILETPLFQGFLNIYLSFLVINTTLSTWLDTTGWMSWLFLRAREYIHILFRIWAVCGNISKKL